MSLGSVTARNNDLAANYGDNASSVMPTVFWGRLYVGDPADPVNPGVEFVGNGYSRPVLVNSTGVFGAPANGQLTPATIFFGTSTAAWSAAGSPVPTHFALSDVGTDDLYDVLEIPDNDGITEAGQTVSIVGGDLVIEVS